MGETGFARGWPEVLSCLDRHGISGQRTPDTADLQGLMATYRIPVVSIASAGWTRSRGLRRTARPALAGVTGSLPARHSRPVPSAST